MQCVIDNMLCSNDITIDVFSISGLGKDSYELAGTYAIGAYRSNVLSILWCVVQ